MDQFTIEEDSSFYIKKAKNNNEATIRNIYESFISNKRFDCCFECYKNSDIKYVVYSKQELRDIVEVLCHEDFGELDLSWIDTSKLSDMSNLFRILGDSYHISEYKNNKFNCKIEEWDVSNVTNMRGMFYGCGNFNQPLDKWDVSNVVCTRAMFEGCKKFNQPLNSWNTQNLEDPIWMFCECSRFNQPLSNWKMSKVTNINYMFELCHDFDQDLSMWDVSNVEYGNAFSGCHVSAEHMPKFNTGVYKWSIN